LRNELVEVRLFFASYERQHQRMPRHVSNIQEPFSSSYSWENIKHGRSSCGSTGFPEFTAQRPTMRMCRSLQSIRETTQQQQKQQKQKLLPVEFLGHLATVCSRERKPQHGLPREASCPVQR